MSGPLIVLQVALGLFAAGFIGYWWRARRPAGAPDGGRPRVPELAIGFGTNFFDTLGIGSFAPTTSLFRFFKLVPDERIPGTLNVGHTIATVVQAFIFTTLIEVEFATLAILIVASILGAWLGAGIVAGWPRRRIQIGMGVALLVAATLFILANLGIVAAGGSAMALSGAKLVIGAVGNFILGALMTLGIGLYGPCLIMISFLGMNPAAAFPIMMGSCAFLMSAAGTRFVRAGAYNQRVALGLLIGGVPAVLIAAPLVGKLSITEVRWLVAAVVLYAAITMLRSAIVERGNR